jgi:hypothetical protein
MTGNKGFRKGRSMVDEEGSWLNTGALWFAVASIVLVFVNGGLALRNQGDQRDVNQRQQMINQAAQFSRVGQLLVETIAKVSIVNKDDTLNQLLERHGIKVNVTPTPAPEKKP